MRLKFLRVLCSVLASAFVVVSVGCRTASGDSPSVLLANEFANPQPVQITGYSGEAMEPFLSRDGKLLFFNNSNDPHVNTNLHWATRVDDLTFQYKGELQGVNTNALEGVASMDRNNVFYFVSNRSYDQTASTIYRGIYQNGGVAGIELAPGVSIAKPGIVNFDAEISADGNTLYFVESQFSHGQPKSAIILIARKNGAGFVRVAEDRKIMEQINTRGINYAPSTSGSELELFFTRADDVAPAIYVATRSSTSAPFGQPRKIAAITGFVEAPTLSPDGRSLYFHKMDSGRFRLYLVTRR
jgi:Tol biopolymer transport system component